MSANANSAAPKSAQKPARRLLVRMNATLFHCLGAAVLLEHAAAGASTHTPDGLSNGIHSEERQKLAQWLRTYTASIWPEFGWDAACASMSMCAVPQQPMASSNSAVASDHRALFYRAVSAIAEDAQLCRVLRQVASIEESRLDGVAMSARPGSAGALRSFQSIRAYVEHTRNRVVRRAFDLLQQHWADAPPFPALDYDAFLARAYALLAPHLQLDWKRRLLYRGWLRSRASYAKKPTSGVLSARSGDVGARMHDNGGKPACALPRASVVR